MRFIFIFFISISLFSQNTPNLNITPIYIHAENVSDIRELNLDSIEPYIYTAIPDLSVLDVNTRKQKFIQLILPAILFEKAKIKKMYSAINDSVIESLYTYCDCTKKQELFYCLSEQPNSIIISQAIIESGWGTSRFFLEGFNLFGIHSYYLDEMTIQAIGSNNSSPVYVKKYNDILSSISHYLRTLARSNAYKDFRKHRFENDSIFNLLLHLKKYSERRELYIKDLRDIIEYNNLSIYDNIEVNWE